MPCRISQPRRSASAAPSSSMKVMCAEEMSFCTVTASAAASS
jgi:hypothetical protein